MPSPRWLRRLRDIWSAEGRPRRPAARTRPALEELDPRLTPTVSVADASLVEGNSGQRDMVFTLTRTGDLSAPLSVEYATANGTATTPGDYLRQSGRVTFAAGAATATVSVPVVGDTLPEPDETFLLRVSAPSTSFAAARVVPAGRSPHEIAVADINGDGRPDVVTANGDSAGGTSGPAVLLNTTAAGAAVSFAAPQEFAAESNPYGGLAVGDFNGDGRPDVAVANYSAGSVSVLLNTTPAGAAAASFAPRVNFAATGSPHDVAVGDINGDGRPDIVAVSDFGSAVSVLLNTTAAGAATPTFSTRQLLTLPWRAKGLALADLNGDGRVDIAAGSGNNNVTAGNLAVFLNTTAAGAGTATFAARQDFTVNTGPISLVAADLNGDGRADLAAASQSTNSVSVLLNATAAGAPTASFGASQSFAVGANSWDLTAADFNGDGRPDLATANFGGTGPRVSVLVNTTVIGAPATFLPFQALDSFGALAVAAADFDADGRVDLAAARFFVEGSVAVFANTTATFARAEAVGTVVDDDGSGNRPPVLAPIADRTVPDAQDVVTVGLSATDPDGDPVTFTASAQSLAYVLDGQLGLRTDNGNLYENVFGANEKWLLDSQDRWHFVLPSGEFYRWDGSGGATGTLVGNVGALYHARPELLFNAQEVAALDAQLGLSFAGDLYENYGGRGERWLLGAGGVWHFVLPTGDLYRWDGGAGANGALVGNVGAGYHQYVRLLYEADRGQAPAALGVSGSTLTIDRDDGLAAALVVSVTASDGRGGSDTRVFSVTVV